MRCLHGWNKAAARRPRVDKADGEAAVLARIAAMPAPYRALGEGLHALILRSAPALQPKLFYGMPGYAEDGSVVCFFRADRYTTFGLTDKAKLTRDENAPHQLFESAWYFTAPGQSAGLCVPLRLEVGHPRRAAAGLSRPRHGVHLRQRRALGVRRRRR